MSDQNQNNATNIHGVIAPQLMKPAPKRDAGFFKILKIIWQRKLTIFITMIIIASVTFLYLNTVSPRYVAQSSILIKNKIHQGGEAQNFVSALPMDIAIILSEAEVIKSRDLAKEVILQLGLMNDPEFNLQLSTAKTNIFDKYFGDEASNNPAIPKVEFKQLSVYKQNFLQDEETNLMDQNIGLVVDNFLENMKVQPAPGSFVLDVEFQSKNPVKAALISNKIVDTYIEKNVAQSSAKFTNWLEQRLDFLRAQVLKSEEAVENFKIENNLITTDVQDLNEQQLSALNEQFAITNAKKAQVTANLQKIQNWIKNPADIKLMDDAGNSPVLADLKVKENELLTKISKLSVRYGPKYPKMVSAQAELQGVRDQIKRELESIAKNIKEELKFSENNFSKIENSLGFVDGKSQEGGLLNIHLNELTRQFKANQAILSSFLQTYNQAADQDNLKSSQTRIISYATIPLNPDYPNKVLILSLSLIGSFFIGLALVFLLESRVKSFHTSEKLEEETGFKCLGLVPSVSTFDTNKPIADYILTKPALRMAESMRSLRMVVKLRAENKGQKSKVITVTSSLPGEGKTTLSTWLARMSAKSAERTIILDCDLRRPRLHTVFGKEPENTLVEYLTGKCTLEEAIFRDPVTNAHAIFGRAVPNNALDLLGKDRMRNLIEALRARYDLVILDSPACLSVTDARLLASKSDQVLYAVAWKNTNKEVVHAGLKQFAEFGYDAVNLVLTHVDLKQYVQYGFSECAYYYSAYNPYYAD